MTRKNDSLNENVGLQDSQKPFQLFGLEPTFDIDETWLEDQFLKRQIELHPDQFYQEPAAQKEAEKSFAEVVQAYETLKNPKSRARLLFQQKGLWPVPHDPDVLDELLEIEEDYAKGTLSADDVAERTHEAFDALTEAFAEDDLHAAGTAFMVWNALIRIQTPKTQEQQTLSH